MAMTNILKIAFLFLGVWFTLVNTTKTIAKNRIPVWNFILQAIGITGFVYLQWLM